MSQVIPNHVDGRLTLTFRYLAVVLLLAGIGAGLLGMRQQQLNDKHAIAVDHTQMKADRELIKDLQIRIARLSTPDALKHAVDRSRLKLEPITSAPGLTTPPPPDPAP